MNVVDPSGWIEYLSGGPNADFFADAIQESDTLLVPTLSLFEVFKHVLRHAGREEALRVAAAMRRGTHIDLDSSLALEAAELSAGEGLALADSVIPATARSRAAVLWTQDRDFEGVENIRFRPKG